MGGGGAGLARALLMKGCRGRGQMRRVVLICQPRRRLKQDAACAPCAGRDSAQRVKGRGELGFPFATVQGSLKVIKPRRAGRGGGQRRLQYRLICLSCCQASLPAFTNLGDAHGLRAERQERLGPGFLGAFFRAAVFMKALTRASARAQT